MQSERERRFEAVMAVSDFTVKERAAGWLRNLFHNEESIRSGNKLETLRNRLKDKPCIIVGGGPSLDKNKHLLKNAKGRAFIICVDTAFEAIKNIVKPDIIIALEARDELLDLVDVKAAEGVTLIADLTVTPKIVEAWNGSMYWFTTGMTGIEPMNATIEKDFNDGKAIGRVLGGGCVANAGFAVAKEIFNCDPIILVGMDCSFPTASEHHAEALVDNIEQTHKTIVDEDIYGNVALTTEVFRAYRYWIEGIIRTANPHTGKLDCEGIFINATEGGTIKNGWLIMSLETVILKYLKNKYNFEDFLDLDKEIVGKEDIVGLKRIKTFSIKKGAKEVSEIEDKNDRDNAPKR